MIDTRRLVERCERKITLSAINSGATARAGAPRGPDTFQPIRYYDYEAAERRCGAKEAIAEVAVECAVPDVAELVLRVERRHGADVVATSPTGS